MNAEGEWNGQKRQTTDLLAYLKDEGKWTWDQIGAALDKIASFYENGDLETDMPNSRRIKRIELVLDEMLSNGYTNMDGIEIAPDRGWLEYKKELPGAEAQAIPENAEYGVYEAQYDDTQYSARVTDEDTLDFLDNQDTVTTYKTMQLVDGKLYPPMAAVVAGKYEDHSVLGTWEQATEHPELIKLDKKGKPQFNLNKGQGKGNVPAAYNPYMHSSNLVLNDQFSSAYNRPNLVTVECEVPVSELASGYKAQYAKDAVGWHSWHTGTVAGALRKATGMERQVLLSRWIKPVRIVPDAEVAQMYKDLLDGTGVEVPDNVVPPNLLNELKKAGVPIKESGKVAGDVKLSARIYSYDELVAKPAMKVTYIDERATGRKDAIAQSKENVERYADKHDRNGTPMMYVPDLGKHVIVGGKGIRHGLGGRRTSEQAAVIANVGDILYNAVVVNEAVPKNENATNSYILIGAARNSDGELIVVRFAVNQFSSELEDIYCMYAAYGKKNRTSRAYAPDGQPIRHRNLTGSEISIADLLEEVKGKFDDVISADVAEHLGIGRTRSEFSGALKFSTRDPYEVSDREILANALEDATKNADEKAWLEAYKKDLAELNATQAILDENRSIISSLEYRKYQKKETLTKEETERLEKARVRVKALVKRLAERQCTSQRGGCTLDQK